MNLILKNLIEKRILPIPHNESQEKFLLALIFYIAGDVYGSDYEFKENPPELSDELRGNGVWPAGGVSDDTTLTLLTFQTLNKAASEVKEGYRALLAEACPRLRGLGPTTRNILGIPVEAHEQHLIGSSNGAVMRLALAGTLKKPSPQWIDWIRTMAKASHENEIAYETAVLAAVTFSLVFRGSSLATAARQAVEISGVSSRSANEVFTRDDWNVKIKSPVSLDPLETVEAVLAIAQISQTPWEAMRRACSLGGDTDTVAALSSSLNLLINWNNADQFLLPIADQILWSEVDSLYETVSACLEFSRER